MARDLVLEARSLACERGGRQVFSGLDFKITAGEMVELRGPNGAGKSSLLRLLAGLNPPASGSVTLGGESLRGDHAHYIGHNEAVKPALSVAENLAFWQKFLGGGQSQTLAPFRLEKLAQDEARLLSEGQRRRLALSRLTNTTRPLWLLDEPSVGLDRTALADLRREMGLHRAQGGIIIAATHADLGVEQSQVLEMAARP